MPKTTCQLALTFEVSETRIVERIAHDSYLRAGGAGAALLRQRLALEAAGWELHDKRLAALLEAVCRLSKTRMEALEGFVGSLKE